MKIVRCINENFNFSEICKKFIDLGEPTPKLNEIYKVSSEFIDNDLGYSGYELEEFDWTELGIRLFLNTNNFEIVDRIPTFWSDKSNKLINLDTIHYKTSFTIDFKEI